MGWLQDPDHILRRICLSMWSDQPAMRVDGSAAKRRGQEKHIWHNIQFANFASQHSERPAYGGGDDGFAPFPRMRTFPMGSNQFSAPLACPLSVLQSLLFDESGDPAPFPNLVTNWLSAGPDALAGCRQPLVVQTTGDPNDLCGSWELCRSGHCEVADPLVAEMGVRSGVPVSLEQMYAGPYGYSYRRDYWESHLAADFGKAQLSWGRCKPCPSANLLHSFMVETMPGLTTALGTNSANQGVLWYSFLFNAKAVSPYCVAADNHGGNPQYSYFSQLTTLLHKFQKVIHRTCPDWVAKYSLYNNIIFFEHAPTAISIVANEEGGTVRVSPSLVGQQMPSCDHFGTQLGVADNKTCCRFNYDSTKPVVL